MRNEDGQLDRRCYPLNFMLNEIPSDQLGKFIQLVEGKFRYIRYSYLYDAFMMYLPRITGTKYVQSKNIEWDMALGNHSLPQIVQEWFPDAAVEEYLSEREKKYQASWQLWDKYGFELDVVYPKETIDHFKSELSAIWGMKQINPMMKQFSHYEYVKAGKANKKGKFRNIEMKE